MFKTLLLLFAFTSFAGQPPTELISVYAEGVAQLDETNYTLSRESATKDALGKALWNVTTILLTQEEIEFNIGVINEFLISRGMEYVQSYKFIEDIPDEDGRTYTTGMQFTFFLDRIKLVLAERGVTFEQRDKPKVLLLIDERGIGVTDASFLFLPSNTEKRLQESLAKMGFNTADRLDVRKLDDNKQVIKALNGELDAVRWLSDQVGAAFLVLGKAKAVTRKYEDGTKWVEGGIDATVYDGTTLDILWNRRFVKRMEDTGGGAGFHALRMAAETFDGELQEFLYESVNAR